MNRKDCDEVSPQESNVISYSLCYDESEEDGFNIKLSDKLSDSALFSCEDATPKQPSIDAMCYTLGEEEDNFFFIDDDDVKYNNVNYCDEGKYLPIKYNKCIKYNFESNRNANNANNSAIDMPKCKKLKKNEKDKCMITDFDSGPYIKANPKPVNNESKKKIYTCSFQNCNRKFCLPASLKLHQQLHKLKGFKCKYCGLVIMDHCNLKLHESKHTDENNKLITYPCCLPDCNETFISRHLLRQHEISYHSSSSGKFLCKFCDKPFAKVQNYMHHLKRVHSGKLLYSCPDCGKCFSDRMFLSIHKKIHGPRKYECNLCFRDFYSASNYIRHKNVHRIKRYTCSKCSSSFNYPVSLSKHMNYAHSISKSNYKLSVCDQRKKNHSLRVEKFLKSCTFKMKKD